MKSAVAYISIEDGNTSFEAGVNFYAYVNNNPLNNNDPSEKICGTGACVGAALSIARTETIIASGRVAQNTPALLAGTSFVADKAFDVTGPGTIRLPNSTLGNVIDTFNATQSLRGASINFGIASMNTASVINNGIDFAADSITSAFNSGFNLTSDFIQNDLPSVDSFLNSIPTIGTPGTILGSELGRDLFNSDISIPTIPAFPSNVPGWQGVPYRK